MTSESTDPIKNEAFAKEAGKSSGNNRRASAAALIDAFAQEYQADRREASGRERHRIFREWLTIIGLFLAAIVAFFQWRELRSTDHNIAQQAQIASDQRKVMQEQLNELRSSGLQTDALITAARNSAESAKRSSDLAEKSLVAANRPWIKVDIQVAGPISYNVNGANFTLRYILTNIGRSPAVNVDVSPRLIFPIIGGDNPNFDPRGELRKSIAERKGRPPSPFGYSLFPGETIAQEVTVTMSHDEIKSATKVLGAIYPTIIGSAH